LLVLQQVAAGAAAAVVTAVAVCAAHCAVYKNSSAGKKTQAVSVVCVRVTDEERPDQPLSRGPEVREAVLFSSGRLRGMVETFSFREL
jgi:hypothetical protein